MTIAPHFVPRCLATTAFLYALYKLFALSPDLCQRTDTTAHAVCLRTTPLAFAHRLGRGGRDEERLGDRRVDGRGGLGVGLGDLGVAVGDVAGRALDGRVDERDVAGGGLARNELLPRLVALVNNFMSIFL